MPLDCNLQSSARGLSPLLPISPPSSPVPAAYHGIVPITNTYMSSYQTRMGTRQNIQSAKCRLSEIDIGEPAAATLHVSLARVENVLFLSHWSKTFFSSPSFPSPYFLLVVFLSHLFIRRISVCQFLLLIHPREKLFKGRSLLPEPPLNSSRPFASPSSSHSALSASARGPRVSSQRPYRSVLR